GAGRAALCAAACRARAPQVRRRHRGRALRLRARRPRRGRARDRLHQGHSRDVAIGVTVTGLERVLVIGSTGAGKTAFARRLSDALGWPYIELDALFWGPSWTPRPDFASLADSATAGQRWVVDGNYSKIRQLLWPRATSVVWLNYSFLTVFMRTLHRTVR